MRQRE